MHQKKHKRKTNRIVIFTSDAVDAKIRQVKLRPWLCNLAVMLLCILIGVGIGFFYYEGQIWNSVQQTVMQRDEEKLLLEQENLELKETLEEQDANIVLLGEVANQKAQEVDELSSQLAEQYNPTGFPLKGAASVQEVLEGDPQCIFTGSENVMVVAAANGEVVAVTEDETYGHQVVIDHGNGYQTIYRNQAEVQVKVGEVVTRGTTIYIMGTENLNLGYQMTKDGVYINPMDVLSISG